MWCVRESYKCPDGSFLFSYSLIFSDKNSALRRARLRRSVLNSHWVVELCCLGLSALECVV